MNVNGFDFIKCKLQDAILISPFTQLDTRGGFIKLFEKKIYKKSSLSFSLTESFVSVSDKNVIRGLHFQLHNPQAKLVSVLHGAVFDVIVDLRKNSPTYKKWESFELNCKNHYLLYIPRGFAHGFLSLEDQTIMLYQCEGSYDKETDSGIRFDDSDLAIQWPVDDIDRYTHSARDLQLMSFKEYERNPMES